MMCGETEPLALLWKKQVRLVFMGVVGSSPSVFPWRLSVSVRVLEWETCSHSSTLLGLFFTRLPCPAIVWIDIVSAH